MNSKSSTNRSAFFVVVFILPFFVSSIIFCSLKSELPTIPLAEEFYYLLRKTKGKKWCSVGYKSSRKTYLLDTHVAELYLGNICEGYFKCIVLKAKKAICINFFHFALEVQRNSIFKAKYHHRLHISLCNRLTTKVMTHKEKIYHDIYHFSWVQLNYIS